MNKVYLYILFLLVATSCSQAQPSRPVPSLVENKSIVTGAERTDMYLPQLKGKRVAVVANQTSVIGHVHLVDTLLSLKVNVVKVFAPEHGFRGDTEAGGHVADSKDSKTGLPLISLYGKNKKPSAEMLKDVDVLIFDIQDVGARFYTYISTMHYVMEAAARNNKEVFIFDRPNPNGFYVDGPVLDMKYSSFVGMHPIPVVHGCTVGELANMINGEGWLGNDLRCKLTVIPCEHYSHSDLYNLPVKPSPNLPNIASVYLYPSICWFEGTIVSVGRGTDLPFQSIGYPGNSTGKFEFTPVDKQGEVNNPMYEGQKCTGHNLAEFGSFYFTSSRQLYLEWITGLYENCQKKESFFTSTDFFDKLAGSDILRKQLIAGTSASDIRKSWEPDLEKYKAMRKKYLIYNDFQ